MLDTASYGEWNPFVEKAECASRRRSATRSCCTCAGPTGGARRARSGSACRAAPRGGRPGRATLAYVYEGLPAKLGLVRGTRYQRLWQQPGGPTHYDTVEEFSGPLVRLAGPNRVEDGFRRHAEALKQRCEA